jgi:hypothetical protein
MKLLEVPVARQQAAAGFIDHLRMLTELEAFPRSLFSKLERKSAGEQWAKALLRFPEAALDRISQRESTGGSDQDIKWYSAQASRRLHELRRTTARLMPWMLPDFAELRQYAELGMPGEDVPLKDLPEVLTKFAGRLQRAIDATPPLSEDALGVMRRLLSLVSGARMDSARLIQHLEALAADADSIAQEMKFDFLWDARRRLLSIGFDAGKDELHSACYDLLASEARIAAFVAIAKDDIPQETWFLLARTHTLDQGNSVLISWTGTMFEYLMPALWMRTYFGTLLDRSRHGVVVSQQAVTASKRIPWGMSESSYATRDAAGNYGYYAFGVPALALHHGDVDALVISPYSSFLALTTAPKAVLHNLRKLAHEGCFGRYGFYEAADFTSSRDRTWRHPFELVRCWMAHHQGMSLLAIANFLADGIVQEWFHSHPRVQATELLLHEKPVSYIPAISA